MMENRSLHRPDDPYDSTIECSVGVFAYNEEQAIGRLLESLLRQRLRRVSVKEIIVIASGCTDATVERIKEYQAAHPQITLIAQARREGKSAAIHLFLRSCRTSLVAVVNGDLILDDQALEHLMSPFQSTRVGMTGGRPVSLNDINTFTGFLNHFLWLMHHEMSLRYPKLGELIAYRVCDDIYFPRDTVDDEGIIEAYSRSKERVLWYVPEAVCYNHGPTDLREYIMRRRNIYAGHIQLAARTGYHVSTMRWKNLVRTLWPKMRRLASGDSKRGVWIGCAVILEIYARLLALYDFFILKKDHSRWVKAASARQVKYDTVIVQDSTV